MNLKQWINFATREYGWIESTAIRQFNLIANGVRDARIADGSFALLDSLTCLDLYGDGEVSRRYRV